MRSYNPGLIGPGDRKNVQRMAERLVPGDYDRLHDPIATGVRDAASFEERTGHPSGPARRRQRCGIGNR